MDEKARKSYNDVEAVDILHQVSNFYISTKGLWKDQRRGFPNPEKGRKQRIGLQGSGS